MSEKTAAENLTFAPNKLQRPTPLLPNPHLPVGHIIGATRVTRPWLSFDGDGFHRNYRA